MGNLDFAQVTLLYLPQLSTLLLALQDADLR